MGWFQIIALIMAKKQADMQSEIVTDQAAVQTASLKTKASQREADRKKQLAEAMSASRAQGGAGSASLFEGSPLAILEEDLRQANIDTERDQFNTDVSVLTERYKASSKKSQARLKMWGQMGSTFATGAENGMFA